MEVFPKELQKIVLKGKEAISERPESYYLKKILMRLKIILQKAHSMKQINDKMLLVMLYILKYMMIIVIIKNIIMMFLN